MARALFTQPHAARRDTGVNPQRNGSSMKRSLILSAFSFSLISSTLACSDTPCVAGTHKVGSQCEPIDDTTQDPVLGDDAGADGATVDANGDDADASAVLCLVDKDDDGFGALGPCTGGNGAAP